MDVPVEGKNAPVDVPVEGKNAPVNVPDEGRNAPVDVPVEGKNAPVNAPVVGKNVPVNVPVKEKILVFCETAKNVLEIAEFLGYKDKRSVRKYLSPLVAAGRIAMTIPDKPNSKNQKYITIR